MGGQTATKASTNSSAECTGQRSQAHASRHVPSGSHADVLALQRSAGNRAVTQVLEAEGSNRPPTGNVHEDIQTSAVVHEVLRSPGEALDKSTNTFMERRFGFDFSEVRMHTDARAAESARAVNALAYTVGRDVVFAAGQYSPHTAQGRGLLAHELAHVIQQSTASSAPADLAFALSSLEHEAEAASSAVLSGHAVPAMQQASRALVARAPETPAQEAERVAKELRDALNEQVALPNEWLNAKVTLDSYEVELDGAKARLKEIQGQIDLEKIDPRKKPQNLRQRKTEIRKLERTNAKKTKKAKKAKDALTAIEKRIENSAKNVKSLAKRALELQVDVGHIIANLKKNTLFGDRLAEKFEELENKGGGTHGGGGGGRTGGGTGAASAAGGAAPSGKAGKSAESRITKALSSGGDKLLKVIPFVGIAG